MKSTLDSISLFLVFMLLVAKVMAEPANYNGEVVIPKSPEAIAASITANKPQEVIAVPAKLQKPEEMVAAPVKPQEALVAVPAAQTKLPVEGVAVKTRPEVAVVLPQLARSPEVNVVELPVASDSSIERDQAFAQALKATLVATSNNQSIANVPVVKTALSKPELYVKQFNYINKSAAFGKTALFVRITLDSKAIDKLLQRVSTKAVVDNNSSNASQLVAVSSKPQTLVWLVKKVGGGRILSDEGVDDGLAEVLKKKSQELNLPIILPALDLQDVNSMKVSDVCNFNLGVIKTASNRYGSSSIIVGCIKPAFLGKSWSGQWLLLQDTKSYRFNFTGESAEGVINQSLPTIVNSILSVVKTVSGQDTKVVLRIANVNGLGQYDEVVRYLRDSSKAITQVDPVNIGANDVELAINVVGGQQELLNILNIRNKLVPNSDITASPPGIDLDYKWVTLENEKSQAVSAQFVP